ncbi:MAG: RIP metalloprotease RseP [Verrucomicrobia bacterium]|nr:RIP metalloprotease RseP [Verrucomicrobiota bacterium]
MQILNVVVIGLEVLVLFNLLIFVHELGHFLAARWRKLKIERFAIWFGKPLWKAKWNGVEYVLGTIPAGGYVSLPQMATMEVIEGKTEEPGERLPPISPLDKILVAFAGPLFSFGLALVFAVVVWMVGRPVSEAETTTTIGYVEEDGPAAQAGLRAGDTILAVDGKRVTKFGGMGESIQWRVIRSEGQTIPVRFERDGQVHEVSITPAYSTTKPWQRKPLRQIHIAPAMAAVIGRTYSNSPAALAGLKPGDDVVALQDRPVVHPRTVSDFIAAHPTQPLPLTVRRGLREFHVTLKPEVPLQGSENQTPMIGILWAENPKLALKYPQPLEQIVDSVSAMVSTFEALFSRKSDVKPQHLGGFIKIINVYYVLFQTENGWRQVLWFSVLLNVNLALLNLLPIPVLDGGHITLALFESIARRPLSGKVVQYIQTSCALLLIGFMLYIAFYDVQELPWKREPRPQLPELIFAPKDGPP